MELLERIEGQIAATGLPLVGVTLAAVPCPDTPVILTLHWHGFVPERRSRGQTKSYTALPSSALQLNDRWQDLGAVDRAAMEAAWALGAWDVARAERQSCLRAGASATEAAECLQAFAAYSCGSAGETSVVSEAPDRRELMDLAAQRGYLTWLFRPVSGGIWAEYADDATLTAHGRRAPPCPYHVIPPRCDANRRTVYRFGVDGSTPQK